MALRVNGSNLLPIVDPSSSNYPHLYKPFKLPEEWYFQIYGNAFFDYANKSIESETNAKLFAIGMTANGWKLPQICAILGNIASESTYNPGLWERAKGQPFAPTPASDYQQIPDSHGFGLVQWTPAADIAPWANEVFGSVGAYDADTPCWYNGTVQIAKLMWELENDTEWSRYNPPYNFPIEMDFYNADKTADDIEDLTECWFFGYEQAGQQLWDLTGANRIKWAKYWYAELKDINLNPLPIWFICKAARNWR